MMKNLTKRYTPLSAIGTFICSHCVIDSAKDIIGLDIPEILQVTTHKKNSDDLNQLAMKCLSEILVKQKLNTSLFVLDTNYLMNNNFYGTIFLGARTETIGENETRNDFFERIKKEIIQLDLLKTKVDDDMSDDEKEHYDEMFDIKFFNDIVVTYTKKEDQDDLDDLDIGYDKGMFDGMEGRYYMIQVALYKMSKKKKIKNLDYILEEIHNTIKGMDENDFKIWSRNFKKYMAKKLKKEQNIEGE